MKISRDKQQVADKPEQKTAVVFVRNMWGKAINPTKPGKAYRLVRDGKAVPVCAKPYPAPPAPTYAAPPPPPVVYVAPVVLPAAPPQFVFVPELGYYVAAGVAFDMLYDGRSYYYHNGGYWYRTAYYGGAWSPVAQRMMPPMILKFQIGDIHRFSNKEFHRYKTEGARYRGKTHRPEEHRGREGEREREIKREEHR